MRTIDKIILHCAATPEGRDVKTETIKSWHVKGNGWSDIGYHFVIELDGTIRNGRPVERSGAHTKGHNATSIGICYVGGMDKNKTPKDTRNEAQRQAMDELIQSLRDVYPTATIHGHNEFAAKACPSFDVQKEYGHLNKVDEPKAKAKVIHKKERIMIQHIKSLLKSKGQHLLNVWQYSDAQPTEITLALVNLLLAPLATRIELGPLYLYQITLVCAGVFQLFCVANGDLKCRVRASIVTFGLFSTTLMMYVVTIGLSTPSHWGWCVLVFSAFGSLKRLKTEELHRHE